MIGMLGGIKERWKGFLMKVSYCIIFFTFFFLTVVRAMDPDLEMGTTDYATKIMLELAQTGKNVVKIPVFLAKSTKWVFPSFGKQEEAVPEREPSEEIKSALKASNANLEEAQKKLGLLKNTARRNQLIGGGAAFLFGLSKGIYDFTQYWDQDARKNTDFFWSNSSDIVTDLGLVLSGAYTLKIALSNEKAKDKYNHAVMLRCFVMQAAQLEQLQRQFTK